MTVIDYVTKGRFPFVPAVYQKKVYGKGWGVGDGVTDHRRREGGAYKSPVLFTHRTSLRRFHIRSMLKNSMSQSHVRYACRNELENSFATLLWHTHCLHAASGLLVTCPVWSRCNPLPSSSLHFPTFCSIF